nr:4779_t:CDS:10 [Entrophospora candida]CAG8586087.1 6687_t:CDS:10 [Entrophospora candida]
MIRHFEYFAGERRLLQIASLSFLKDTRLGIDGAHWLRKLLQTCAKEPAIAALGGIPIGLKNAIEEELQQFKLHGITPVFVFNGLSIIRKDKPFSSEDTRPSKRAQAWDLYEKGRMDAAYSNWVVSGSIHQPELLYFVFKILKENDVEFIRAPYLAWGQRNPKGYIHAIYGSSELLMYNVEKVIISLELEKDIYTWYNKKTILHELGITDEQFLDACVLAGFEHCGTFPPLNVEYNSFHFKSVLDLIKQYRTGFNAVQNYAEHQGVIKTNYVETYCRTQCAIKYHMVLTEEGKVEPLNSENSPSDIHDVIGYRLPDEIYYYLSRGLMSPQVINTLISGVLIENPPLCNGETQEYRQFLNQLLEIRTYAMGLLTQPLHQFYQSRKVISVYWFEPNNEHTLNHNVVPSVHDTLNTWNVLEKSLEEEKKAQNTPLINLAFCLRATMTESQSSKTIMPKNNDKMIESKDEILSNVLWKLLELRKFLTSSHTQTAWGVAFTKALKPVDSKSEQYIEQLFSALELIRFGYLNGNHYSKGKSWNGPLNRELLAFNSFLKTLNRSLRNLCEMLTLSMFLNGDCLKERNDYLDIALSLPFLFDVNTGLGIVAKTYLENIISSSKENEDKSESSSKIASSIKKLEETFTSCVDVKSDLLNGFSFWDQIIVAINSLKANGTISDDLSTQFLKANEWLSTKRP